MSRTLQASVLGVGLLGPGLDDWPATAAILRGERAWQPAATVLPLPDCLPPAERRRTGTIVKLALRVGMEACRAAETDPAQLPAVFTSSGGDGENCDQICRALASAERSISPTRFHNSVHNAAAGYWGIATGAMRASNALCAYDASFAAGLLEASVQLTVEKSPVLLVAYDASYPAPLRSARPIPDAFGVALVLAPAGHARSLAQLTLTLVPMEPSLLAGPLEELRRSIPAARSLPLLAALAGGAAGEAVLEYLQHRQLHVQVAACH
ncbi:MAG: beta-ketoacyl synthase chain length factor [Gammaproteobacteria bacterium]|nr:beta-ketoacyl synthase chain length factor [Gammaproteobacteria bacterium]